MVLLAKPNHPAESRQSRLHYEARSVALVHMQKAQRFANARFVIKRDSDGAVVRRAIHTIPQRFANARFVIKRDSDGAVGERSNFTPSPV